MRLSASQIETFRSCQRKWAWDKIAGVPREASPSAILGSAVHKQLETYLLGGEIDFTNDAGYIAASGIEHLPKPPLTKKEVECEFHFAGPSGNTYLGYKDIEIPGTIYDHKSTKDFKWAKTPEELRTNVQAVLYATDYFRNHPAEKDVALKWVYYSTSKVRKSELRETRVDQDHTWKQFLEIEKTAEEMSIVQDAFDHKIYTTPLELPPTLDHCSAYGGCPFQGQCNIGPFDKLQSHLSHVEQEKERNMNPLLKLGRSPEVKASDVKAPAQINPPEQDLPPPPVEASETKGPAVAPSVAQVGGKSKLLARLQAARGVAAPEVVAAAEAAAVPAAKPGPGRPKGSKNKTPPTNEAPADAIVNVPAGEHVVAKTVELKGSAGKQIGVLYVDCGPVGVPVTDANTFITTGKAKLAAKGIPDWRCGPEELVGFGKGSGLLAAAVAAAVDEAGQLLHVRIDTGTSEAAIVMSDIVARAGIVVR